MKHHFNKFGWPASTLGPAPDTEAAKNSLVDDLQVSVCFQEPGHLQCLPLMKRTALSRVNLRLRSRPPWPRFIS